VSAAIDRSPPRLSVALALGVALVGVLTLVVSGPALGVGILGLAITGISLARGSQAAVTLGSAGVFCGVLLAGLAGSPPELLLFATAAVVVAWDIATFAIGLGEELGRAADTTRLELVHAGASGALALLVAAGGTAVYRLAGSGPTLASIALLCGAVVLVVFLRP
jgi:hypothetical protein